MNFYLLFFVYQASSLAENITSSNWENFTGLPLTDIVDIGINHDVQILKNDSTFFKRNPPLFIFCFTSWCPHCKKARPGWEKFQEEVKEDNNFIACSLNCSSNEELCRSLKIRSLPTFLTYFHGDLREAKGFHDSQAYHQIGKKLSLIQQGKFIQRFNQIGNKIAFPRYPSFVFSFDYTSKIEKNSENEFENNNNIEVNDLNSFDFNVNNESDVEAMEIVSRVIIASNSYQEEYFYLNSTENQSQKDKRHVKVFIDDDVSIEMKEEFTFDNILNFVKENCHQLFGDWSFMSLRSINKRFAVYVPKAKSDNKKEKEKKKNSKKYSQIIDSDVKKFAISKLDKFSWGSAKEFGEERFNKIFKIKNSDLPAIVVIDIRLSRFAKLKKIKSHQEIEDFFNQVENYKPIDDENTENEKKNVNDLFEPLEVNNEIDDMLDLINTIATVFVTSLLILLSISVIGFLIYWFYFKKPVPKYD